MWIVIDIPGYVPENVIIATDEDGQNLLFDTIDQAANWAMENCAGDWQVVDI